VPLSQLISLCEKALQGAKQQLDNVDYQDQTAQVRCHSDNFSWRDACCKAARLL
jgi:hypothetical protein